MPANISQKPTTLMTSLTKKKTNSSSLQTQRLAVSFEGLNSSLNPMTASYGVEMWCENQVFQVEYIRTPALKMLTELLHIHCNNSLEYLRI